MVTAPIEAGTRLQGFKERIYILKDKLGSGSFASVWRAEVQGTGFTFAIKIFEVRDALGGAADVKEAYGREATVLMDVRDARCPHVIRIEEHFEDAETGLFCIVMNLVEGSSLEKCM
jgi:serine/threonine protein kinase